MRHLPTLAPLAALLLSSCEPGANRSATGSSAPQEPLEKAGIKLNGNTATLQQLAAQDSVGKPPQPRNLIADVADTCPVHHVKMKVREIPIVFEDDAQGESDSTGLATASAFPFDAERIVSTGNALLPGEPLSARVYQCASCIAEKQSALEKKSQPVAAQ
jgi:hypothetical protein